jgi:Rieske 2Fe-2S family protein
MDGKPLCNRLMGDIKEWDQGTLAHHRVPQFLAAHQLRLCRRRAADADRPRRDACARLLAGRRRGGRGQGLHARRLLPIWDLTNKQDWTICADQQLGVSSRAYVPGPFSEVRERNVAHFLDWYLGELRA